MSTTGLHSATPVELVAALEKCDLVWPYADHAIHRFRWAADSYIDGYIDKPRQEEEVALFRKAAEELIARQVLREALRQSARPMTPLEEERRKAWLEQLAQMATRKELRRQRKLLRSGHSTLTAIRRVLHGAAPSPQRASTRAKTSPTS